MILADSHAELIKGRVLAQHQSALSLIRQLTQNPSVVQVEWLDLACGRGQILSSVETVISDKRRTKINYRGFDVSKEYARQTERHAKELFANAQVDICELQHFESFLAPGDLFDIVTLTNTVHELSPATLAGTLVAALCRTTDNGCLYIYDMERLPDPELGAIPWEGAEIERVVHQILVAARVATDSLPDVAVWPHKTCACWNLQIHRAFLNTPDLVDRRPEMVQVGSRVISEILREKLFSIHMALNSASRYGAVNVGEEGDIRRLLYDHWAISRALGRHLAGELPNA